MYAFIVLSIIFLFILWFVIFTVFYPAGKLLYKYLILQLKKIEEEEKEYEKESKNE